MSITDALRKGMVIRHNDELFNVLDFRVSQTGKQKPTVHIKLRSLKSGHTGERTLDQIGTIEEVVTEHRQMQYLYAQGEERVFMDTENFEQWPLRQDVIGDAMDFLVEEETYRFLAVEGKIVSLQLAPTVVLEVTNTAPVEHAGGGTSVHKEAVLSSGITIQVPLFIKTGDRIKVRTDNKTYMGKDH